MARRLLVLVRHAKSAWGDPSLDDRERPLAPRGIKALPRLCEHLVRSGFRPQVVLCSPSRRTVATLEGIRAAVPDEARIEEDDELYLASADQLLARLRSIDDGLEDHTDCAMVVGHNPSLEDLAIGLAGSGDADLRAQVATKFPTAAAATLSFDTSWADLHEGGARLDDLFLPRARPG
jgi:phosphohistidine phosphatase